ncbi:MAG: hypothetical protein ACREUN_09095 [Burkholderiales bacterium]
MDKAPGNGDQHLALSTAAAVVYHQVMGTLSTGTADDVIEVLDLVAGAIANVAPIYTSDRPTGTPRQLAPIELIHCRFERGATVLKTSFGPEYTNLSIRRDDMRTAIAILRGARVDFRRRKP